MAVAKVLKGFLVFLPLVVASALPERERAVPPEVAVRRAETQAPSLGLLWGKLRAFARERDGWRLFYQPSHGAWVVSVKVRDLHAPELPSLEAASWLAGPRLSAAAVRRFSGNEPLGLIEGWGRRDWWVEGRVMVGALLASTPPERGLSGADFWWALSLVVGFTLAGAAARRMRPQPRVSAPRRLLLGACALLVFAVPGASRLAWAMFAPGVRPFVSLMVFQGLATVVLGALATAAFAVPAFAEKARWWPVALGFSVGWLLGLSSAPPWAAAVAAVPSRWLLLVAGPVALGFLTDLAAAGWRLLASPFGRWSPLVAGLVGVAGLATGQWGLLGGAVMATALCPSAQGFWFAVALAAGFLPGAWWASVGWWGPLRDALGFSAAVWAVLGVWAFREARGHVGATIAG